MEPTEFRQIRQKTVQLINFKDGLWDMLLGSIFMYLAFYSVLREAVGPAWNLAVFLAVVALLVTAQLVLRRIVSAPRIGTVKPRHSPGAKWLVAFTALLVLLTLALVVVTVVRGGAESTGDVQAPVSTDRGYLVEIVVLAVMGLLFTALGYLFGVARLYTYGWLLGSANLLSVYLSHNAGWVVQVPDIVASAIIILVGAVLLIRFLSSYPVPAETA